MALLFRYGWADVPTWMCGGAIMGDVRPFTRILDEGPLFRPLRIVLPLVVL